MREKMRYTRNNSQGDSSDYAALISSSVRDRHLNQITNSWQKWVAYTHQLDQLRNQAVDKTEELENSKNNSYEMTKTSSELIPQWSLERQNIARLPHRFDGQVIYNDQLQV